MARVDVLTEVREIWKSGPFMVDHEHGMIGGPAVIGPIGIVGFTRGHEEDAQVLADQLNQAWAFGMVAAHAKLRESHDAILDDLGKLLEALGQPNVARPESPHAVMLGCIRDVASLLAAAREAREALLAAIPLACASCAQGLAVERRAGADWHVEHLADERQNSWRCPAGPIRDRLSEPLGRESKP